MSSLKIADAILTFVLLTAGIARSQPCALILDTIPLADVGGKTDAARLDSLRRDLERIRSQFPGEMSIYMKNLSTGAEITLDSRFGFTRSLYGHRPGAPALSDSARRRAETQHCRLYLKSDDSFPP